VYVKKTAAPVPHPRSYAQVVAFVNANLPLYEAALRKLEALKPSSTDEIAFNHWLADDRKAADALRALGLAGQRHDFPGAASAVDTLQTAALASRNDADALGVIACAAG
jgi:hypothetical protein